MQKHCFNCGIEYQQGGNNFCSRRCWRKYNGRQMVAKLKTVTAYDYFFPNIRQDRFKLDPHNETERIIKRQYANTPKTRDMLLAKHREEIAQREVELAGYRYTEKKLW